MPRDECGHRTYALIAYAFLILSAIGFMSIILNHAEEPKLLSGKNLTQATLSGSLFVFCGGTVARLEAYDMIFPLFDGKSKQKDHTNLWSFVVMVFFVLSLVAFLGMILAAQDPTNVWYQTGTYGIVGCLSLFGLFFIKRCCPIRLEQVVCCIRKRSGKHGQHTNDTSVEIKPCNVKRRKLDPFESGSDDEKGSPNTNGAVPSDKETMGRPSVSNSDSSDKHDVLSVTVTVGKDTNLGNRVGENQTSSGFTHQPGACTSGCITIGWGEPSCSASGREEEHDGLFVGEPSMASTDSSSITDTGQPGAQFLPVLVLEPTPETETPGCPVSTTLQRRRILQRLQAGAQRKNYDPP